MLIRLQCIPERLALKQEIIAQLDELAPEDTIIASNSSSYSCSEIVAGLNLKHAKRVLSAHTCTSLMRSAQTYTNLFLLQIGHQRPQVTTESVLSTYSVHLLTAISH